MASRYVIDLQSPCFVTDSSPSEAFRNAVASRSAWSRLDG